MNPEVKVAELLARRNEKVIFAESCTAGLVSATLARVPGVSKYLCGSFVVYRPSQKIYALGVNPETIKKYTTESEKIAIELANGALAESPEATWSLGIVGHLGPGAPPEKDGIIYVSIRTVGDRLSLCCNSEKKLVNESREKRMEEAANYALDQLREVLESYS